MQLQDYVDASGVSPFGEWFSDLDATSAARIVVSLSRMEQGYLAAKGVGAGVLEHKINTGPGYRIYFARDGERLIILLAGGTKRRQDRDIGDAKARWADYKRRKKG